jgi:hypothetical protein
MASSVAEASSQIVKTLSPLLKIDDKVSSACFALADEMFVTISCFINDMVFFGKIVQISVTPNEPSLTISCGKRTLWLYPKDVTATLYIDCVVRLVLRKLNSTALMFEKNDDTRTRFGKMENGDCLYIGII